jgi:hypothetical protein
MGAFSTPDTKNAQGQSLSRDMFDQLGSLPVERRAEVFRNWMFGIMPKAIDPTEAISRANALRPASDAAAMGSGMIGLFGFGSGFGGGKAGSKLGGRPEGIQQIKPLDMGPMNKGVPYSVPPLAKIGR